MLPENIQQVVEEIAPLIEGRYVGKIFQLSPYAWAIDLGLRDGRFLFGSSDPASPRLYLIKRRIKDLEKQSVPRSQFSQLLISRITGARSINITRDAAERVVRLILEADDRIGCKGWILVVQLTGRSANLFLLDEDGKISGAARTSTAAGQSIGDTYHTPAPQPGTEPNETPVLKGHGESWSAALDAHYQYLDEKKAFDGLAKRARSKIRKERQQRLKLKENLEQDLASHGNPDEHKRIGDLLLANLSTAKRKNSKTILKDFYSEGAPEIELEIDKDTSLQEEATRYFGLYAKAKRAREAISTRLKEFAAELEQLSKKQAWLEEVIEARDKENLAKFIGRESESRARSGAAVAPSKIPGVRVYRSSDGYEVLVGRGARDNFPGGEAE